MTTIVGGVLEVEELILKASLSSPFLLPLDANEEEEEEGEEVTKSTRSSADPPISNDLLIPKTHSVRGTVKSNVAMASKTTATSFARNNFDVADTDDDEDAADSDAASSLHKALTQSLIL